MPAFQGLRHDSTISRGPRSGEGQVHIAEEDSGGLSVSLRPFEVAVARGWGGLCRDVRPMPPCLTFIDTQSSEFRNVVRACRWRGSHDGERRADQRQAGQW
jgi:hypothetical protein